jgi:predicted DNA-binding mobile mystery protein A
MPRKISPALAHHTRLALDAAQAKRRAAVEVLARPEGGWIRAIRLALGMSAADLAGRLGVEISTVSRIESSELNGTIKLETLKRFADQLGCDLVYALVPRQSLDRAVNQRAHEIASKRVARLQQTMSLEQQGLGQADLEQLIEREAEEVIRSGALWR